MELWRDFPRPLWRDTMRPARFFMLDARAAFPLVLAVLKVSWVTVGFAAFCIFCFWLVERFGLTFPSALRAIRAQMAGPYRPAVPAHTKRRRVDYSSEPEGKLEYVAPKHLQQTEDHKNGKRSHRRR